MPDDRRRPRHIHHCNNWRPLGDWSRLGGAARQAVLHGPDAPSTAFPGLRSANAPAVVLRRASECLQPILPYLAIALAGLWADEVRAKPVAGVAHPADALARNARQQGERRHVGRHHGPRSNEAIFAEGMAAD